MEHVAQTARTRTECKVLVETIEGSDLLMGVILFSYLITFLCVCMTKTIHWLNKKAIKIKKIIDYTNRRIADGFFTYVKFNTNVLHGAFIC